MNLKALAICLALVGLTATASRAETPTADQVLAQAKTQAQAEHKTIFVHFGASWCGWCLRLEGFLERPEIKSIFDKYFVQVSLVAHEEEKNQALNNPGADKLMVKFGGTEEVPYYAFLDAQGELIINSKRPSSGDPAGENIAFPVDPKELAWFQQMLQKAAPKISKGELAIVESTLKSMSK